MKVAVYSTRQYGPSAAFSLPADGIPQAAFIPHLSEGQRSRAVSQISDKGHALTWEQWADHLSRQLPYFERWSAEEVPDGSTVQQALSVVRRQESSAIMENA